jgi:hypothetical protein
LEGLPGFALVFASTTVDVVAQWTVALHRGWGESFVSVDNLVGVGGAGRSSGRKIADTMLKY